MQLPWLYPLFGAIGMSTAAVAADAESGRRVAEARCVTCHFVGSGQRKEVGDAPPFEASGWLGHGSCHTMVALNVKTSKDEIQVRNPQLSDLTQAHPAAAGLC